MWCSSIFIIVKYFHSIPFSIWTYQHNMDESVIPFHHGNKTCQWNGNELIHYFVYSIILSILLPHYSFTSNQTYPYSLSFIKMIILSLVFLFVCSFIYISKFSKSVYLSSSHFILFHILIILPFIIFLLNLII